MDIKLGTGAGCAAQGWQFTWRVKRAATHSFLHRIISYNKYNTNIIICWLCDSYCYCDSYSYRDSDSYNDSHSYDCSKCSSSKVVAVIVIVVVEEE